MKRILLAAAVLFAVLSCTSETITVVEKATCMNNAYGRDAVSLNGRWNALIDIYDRGEKMDFPLELKPEGKSDFVEYSFDGAMQLDVPGDWNSQAPELEYYEGTVWYARHFNVENIPGTRRFLYFAGVSNRCKVFLNGELVACHEGAFLPFQAEVTGKLRDGDNFLAVKVDNIRREDAIPAMDFDWWNYGGITRDVMLITTPQVYVNDWFISLDKENNQRINVYAELSDSLSAELEVSIPELGLSKKVLTDGGGRTSFNFEAQEIRCWSPSDPKLYAVTICCGGDRVCDNIGFRSIRAEGTSILLNGETFFAKSVSFHEEMPPRAGRACTDEDAEYLLGQAKELGVNMVRLAHYPQNEHIVRLAEKMGIVLWEEIPLWQKIKFSDAGTLGKARSMYREMLLRDRNRCAICFWGLANETRPSEARNAFLKTLLDDAISLDRTRLFTLADDIANYNPDTETVELEDPFIENVDVVAINKYLGWYAHWPCAPEDMKWNVAPGKPLIISEFGGEALYGRRGEADVASSWSEDYQAALYRDNLKAFSNIENLAGISPWVLFDFRSPRRFLPGLQDGWNRKGLISDKGERKQSWQIIHDYYSGK